MCPEQRKYVSRAGDKLAGALQTFELDVAGLVCADFGCNVGGFTDCLLRAGATKVYAVDTGYGELAWTLRKDDRVVVMERTNAMHCDLPEKVDLVVIDVAWTPQKLIVPAALRHLKPGGLIVALLKPHYELAKLAGKKPHHALDEAKSEEVCEIVCSQLGELGCEIREKVRSSLIGKGGNIEFLLLLSPDTAKGADSITPNQ